MSPNEMLRALGYTTSPTGITTFQRDYNLLGSSPVLVTGELDEDTQGALAFAYGARAVFTEIRDRKRA